MTVSAKPNPIKRSTKPTVCMQQGYEHAKQAYLRIPEQISDNAVHARAYYGLARIAVLQNDPEMGERLFQKVLDSSPDAWVKAWRTSSWTPFGYRWESR